MGFIISDIEKRWPGSKIPFEISDADFPKYGLDWQVIQDAIEQWNNKSDVPLVLRNNESDYVIFKSGKEYLSDIGRTKGMQIIYCNIDVTKDKFAIGTVIHEIGHACGLFHEHQRPDRDNFVNVMSTDPRDYLISPHGTMVGDYNCCSIMHYPEIPGKISNVTCTTIGQNTLLTRGDLEAIQAMYPIAEITTLTDTSDYGTSLVFRQDKLFIAWTGEDDHINIANINFQGIGQSFLENKVTLNYKSNSSPALVTHQGQLLLSHTGEDDHIYVAVLDIDPNGKITVQKNNQLGFTSNSSPALVSHQSQLLLSHTGEDDHIYVAIMDVDPNGKVTVKKNNQLGFTSNYSPALASNNVNIILAFTGKDDHIYVVGVFTSPNGTVNISPNYKQLNEESKAGPTIEFHVNRLFLAWRGNDEYLNIMVSDDFGLTFHDKRLSYESSNKSPLLAANQDSPFDSLFISWKGADNENLNIGAITLPPVVPELVGFPHSGNALQSTIGIKGNYELLIIQDESLEYLSHNNDNLISSCDTGPQDWKKNPPPFKEDRIGITNVTLFQSNFIDMGIHGNLEAIARANNTKLYSYSFFEQKQQWAGPKGVIVDGNLINGVSGKPALIQSTFGKKGNLEMLIPLDNELKYCSINMEKPGSPPWADWELVKWQPTVPKGKTVKGVALIQSNYKDDGFHGRLEAIAWLEDILGEKPTGSLYYYYLNTDTLTWSNPEEILVYKKPITGITGNPVFIQSTFHSNLEFKKFCKIRNHETLCSNGDFEMLVPMNNRLAHYYRKNDSPLTSWVERKSEPKIPDMYSVKNVALFQSNFRSNCVQGNLVAIVHMEKKDDRLGTRLYSYCFDSKNEVWKGPFPITTQGNNITGWIQF
ncbi:TPA: hypothetical protein QCU06_005133 [Bacillus cereus]|nr:hypothetical protein [Bacillus cereus]